MDVAMALACGVVIPFMMLTAHRHTIDQMTAVWVLPVVAGSRSETSRDGDIRASEKHGHPHPRAGKGLKFDPRAGVLPKRLHHQVAKFALEGPFHPGGQADPIIENSDLATISVHQAPNRDRSPFAAGKGVLQRIRQKLVHNEARRQSYIN